MDKHIIGIFVPHRKLRPLYYLSSVLLGVLWYLDLNTLNIPLPSKELQTWFLDKLLLTTVVLFVVYSFSTYYLAYLHKRSQQNNPASNSTDPSQNDEPQTLHFDEPKVNILKLLYSHDELSIEDISSTLSLQPQTTRYHLEELKTARMVVWGCSDAWRLLQPGRKYLHDNSEVV